MLWVIWPTVRPAPPPARPPASDDEDDPSALRAGVLGDGTLAIRGLSHSQHLCWSEYAIFPLWQFQGAMTSNSAKYCWLAPEELDPVALIPTSPRTYRLDVFAPGTKIGPRVIESPEPAT